MGTGKVFRNWIHCDVECADFVCLSKLDCVRYVFSQWLQESRSRSLWVFKCWAKFSFRWNVFPQKLHGKDNTLLWHCICLFELLIDFPHKPHWSFIEWCTLSRWIFLSWLELNICPQISHLWHCYDSSFDELSNFLK